MPGMYDEYMSSPKPGSKGEILEFIAEGAAAVAGMIGHDIMRLLGLRHNLKIPKDDWHGGSPEEVARWNAEHGFPGNYRNDDYRPPQR